MIIGKSEIQYDQAEIDAAREQVSTIWVSNPMSNTLHKLTAMTMDATSPIISGLISTQSSKIIDTMTNTFLSVPAYDTSTYSLISAVSSNTMELSGYSGIYSIAVAPNGNVWTADFELDIIYERNANGNILSSINLQTLSGIPTPYEYEYTWYGPNSISLDSSGTLYGTLFNSVSAFKIDTNTLATTFFAPTASQLSASSIPLSSNGYEQDLLRPTKVVTDKNNGIHVAYGNTGRSALVHFNSGEIVENARWVSTTGNLSMTDVIVRHVDYLPTTDDVIVAMYGTDDENTGGIYYSHYNYLSNQYGPMTLIFECTNPYYMALDSNENIWFAYDNNKIGKITKNNNASYVMDIPLVGDTGVDIVGGICVDDMDYVNVIDTYSNIIYRWYSQLDTVTIVNNVMGSKIYPNSREVLVNDDGGISSVTGTAPSLRAFGDWSGTVYKYTYSTSDATSTELITVTLSGCSVPFEIRSFTPQYGVRRFNDSWDMTRQIKSYILPDYQKEFTSLWDGLIGTIVGSSESEYQTFGRQFYEKISNFVLNHMDIDTGNINELNSMFKSFGLQSASRHMQYPPELYHWMNILSVAFEKLRGEQHTCNLNFINSERADADTCENCGQVHPSNLGAKINITITPMVVGVPVVIRDTFTSTNAYDIFYPPISGSYEQLSEYGFRSPFNSEYAVYEYVENPDGIYNTQAEGLINWGDEYNALNIEDLTYTDWFSAGGVVDEIFTRILTQHTGNASLGVYTTESCEGTMNANRILEVLDGDIVNPEFSIVSDGMVPVLFSDNSIAYDRLVPIYAPYNTTDSTTYSSTINPDTILLEDSESTTSTEEFIKVEVEGVEYYIQTYSLRTATHGIVPIIGNAIFIGYDTVLDTSRLYSAGYLAINWGDSVRYIPLYTE
jgi:hypothetical protein